MKTNKQLTFLLMMFLCVCFISIPAMSGEHPWDSDGDDGLYDDMLDSTKIVNPKYGDQSGFAAVSGSTDGSSDSWFTSFISNVSLSMTIWYYDLDSSDKFLTVEKKQHKKVVKRDSKKTYR